MSDHTPKVSVVLSSYNHAKYLRQSIDSVLSQDYSDFELIIWDDASTDDSWEIISSYRDDRIRAFRNETNRYIDHFRQAISEVARGEYIAIHHSDDIWKPEKLAKQVAVLDTNSALGAVFSWAEMIGEDGQSFQDQDHFYYHIFEQPDRTRHEWLNYFFYHGNALCHPSVLIRKHCYQAVGLYRYGMAQIPDLDMWVRLCLKYEIQVLPERLVKFRVRESEANVSGNRRDVNIRYEFEFLQIYQNYLQITNREDFVKVFPESASLVEKEEYDIPFALAMTALSLQNSFGRLFGLQVLFDIINDPSHAEKVQRIYGFRTKDLIGLTAQHDIFSVAARAEKDAQLQKLYQQLTEREQTLRALYEEQQALSVRLAERQLSIQTLSMQIVEQDQFLQEVSEQLRVRSRQLEEKEFILGEMTSSKVWKLALLFRQVRLVLVPPGSRRASFLRQAVNLFRHGIRGPQAERPDEAVELIRASSLFDAEWYLSNNPEVAASKMDPARHYLKTGWLQGCDPGPNFSSRWYLETYKDVKGTGLNPLLHYLQFGQAEGRARSAADLRSQRQAVYKDYKAIVSSSKKEAPRSEPGSNRLLQMAYHVNQRLPLSETGRQKLQRVVSKVMPGFFYRYKRSVNDIVSEKYFASSRGGQRHPTSSFKDLLLEGDQSQLALWSHLLQMSESTLASLLVPPWQGEQGEAANDKAREMVQVTGNSAQALFDIHLFVSDSPAHFIYECIRSVQEQTNPGWRLYVLVDENYAWKMEALSVQFEADSRIRVRGTSLQDGLIGELKQFLGESKAKYVLFLNQYDQLKPEALSQAASEIAASERDLIYCPADLNTDHLRELCNFDDLPADFAAHGVAFDQFIVWKKSYLESLLPANSDSLAESLIHLRDEFSGASQPRSVAAVDRPCYFHREIPGRTNLSLSDKAGHLDLVLSSIPLRVVLDGRLLGRKITGTERYIWELLKELALLRRERDFELRVIVTSKPEQTIDGVEFLTESSIEAIHDAHIFHKTFPASDAGTLAEMGLAASVIYSPLDLILYSNPDYFFSEIDYYHFRKTMQMSVRLSNHIVSISKHGKLEMERLLGTPGDKITPVYLGVRPDHFSIDKQTGRSKLNALKVPDKYFLFVGTNYPHKNLSTLLRAFQIVKQEIPDIHLVLVGTNHYEQPQPELDELLSKLSKHILQLGHVPDDVLPLLYHHACALVYPSLHEGFGLPPLEAMLCGTAVIASDATSLPEVCGAGSAILVNGRDEKQIAEAMLKVWSDPATRDSLIAAGYKNAPVFSWGSTARQTLQCYFKTVDQTICEPLAKRTHEKIEIINELGIDPPTVLIVTHIRFYPPTAGNEQRMLQLVKYLKKLGYRVIMLVNPFLEQSQLDRNARSSLHQYVDYYEEIGDLPLDRKDVIPYNPEIGNEPVLNRWKITEATFCSDAVMERASYLIEQFSPNILIANYIWMSRVLALAAPDMLKVIDTIDMFSRKNESVVKFGIQDTLAATPEEELAFLNRSDVTIAIQDTEAEGFRKLGTSSRVITAGIDLDVNQIHESTLSDTQPPSLLIVGSGNQINVHCVKEFLLEAWPRIHEQIPACRLRIVGKVTKSLTVDDPAVELISYIEDLDSAYAEAAVVVNPVYAGTGIKVKSIEALGHSKAFVCWPEGAAGLTSKEGNPFILVQSWEELVASVVDLLSHPEKRQELENAAGHYAKTKLSDRAIYRETVDCFDAFSKRKLNVLCLYLRYGLNDHPQGLSDLQDWYAGKMTGAQTTTWIIDNKLKTEVDGTDLVTGYRLLSGDNRQREFSAFQKIITEHRAEIEKYDVVHFVTSAFNTLFTGYLDYFQSEHLASIAHRPICLGHIDVYDEPVRLAGESSQSWIRTCFFFMSPETVYSIPSFVSFREEGQFFDAEGDFRDTDELSENYKQNITGWLTGESIQGVSWHNTIPDVKSFAGKTLAILNEHMLAIQLRKAGIRLVDYYWMKEYSPDLFSSIDHPIPDSLEQVQFRQSQLFSIPDPKPMAS